MKIHKVSHYNETDVEVIEVIEAYELNFHLGNAVKYLLRCSLKHENIIEDIAKAYYYLNRSLDYEVLPNYSPKNPIPLRQVLYGRNLPYAVSEAITYILQSLTYGGSAYKSAVMDGVSSAIITLNAEYKLSSISS